MSMRVVSLVLSLTMVMACATQEGGSPEPEVDLAAQREFWSRDENRERLEAYVRANTRFTLLHEAAHYVFDVLEVPIAGREEDAADRLAALLMMPTDAGRGPEAELPSSPYASDLVWVAYSWISEGRGALAQERARMAWYDEHGVDEQRGYQVLCMMYGNNPKRYELALADPEIGILDPKARERFKQQCVRDAALSARAFKVLVGAHAASADEIARKREADLAAQQWAQRPRSGSAAERILRGETPPASATPTLLTSQPPGVFYGEYESFEAWATVPWFPWSSHAFLRAEGMLQAIRDDLFELTLPAGKVLPTIEARGCQGMVNAFYGIDPNMLENRPDWRPALERGLIRPSITICYPLIDAFSWAGRALIWGSEQQNARQ
jgi:hypothetical protein